MNLPQASRQVNVVAARSNGRNYHLTVESPAGQIEFPVPERTYRRALIDYLSQDDIEELNRWLAERDAEVIKMHEADFGEWQPLPADHVLEDMAEHYGGQARANGYVLGASAPMLADKLARLAESKGYETAEDYLDDAAGDLIYIMLDHGCRISREDALQNVIDSEGDVDHAAAMSLEDMDWSDPRDEAHFSPWFLNS